MDNIYFSSFNDGEEATFNLSLLKVILLKHGCKLGEPLGDGFIPVFFPWQGDEETIGSDEGGIALESLDAIEFAIGRPLYDAPMRLLAFELLEKLRLCAYGDGDRIYSVHSLEASAIPDEVLEDAVRGVSIVKSSNDLWT
ncbi:hypothetical protein GTP58_23290 [Duganella sp. CY15W]|uniref:hypothetical protein n=1 Tax=Duganella sp. CY15W TaxID=2692172 RepID=UPI0013720395|nr:hypothetical protein [Duganella sp. CY15W]MYM31268.1 hypothetical protein [Duganella sp. CY15W]